MSLWHADNQNVNKKKSLPELESLPELDNLFDEFESEFKSENDENNQTNSLPKMDGEPTEVSNNHSEIDDSLEKANDELKDIEEPKINKLDEDSDSLEKLSEISNDEILEDIPEPLDYSVGNEDLFVVVEENSEDKSSDKSNDSRFTDPENDELEENEEKELNKNEEEEEIEGLEDNIESDEDESFETISEEEQDNFFGLLPGMNPEDLDEEDLDEKENEESQKAEKIKSKPKKEKGFKELDEERVKEFFMGLLGKLKKGRNKDNDESSEQKPKRDKKQKKEKEPKKKIPKSKNLSKIITIAFSLLFLIVVLFVGYKMLAKPGTPLKNSVIELSLKDKDKVEMKEFAFKDKKLEFTIENKADISKEFFMYITFKNKGKIECESNIISIEPGSSIKETAVCKNKIDVNKSYKDTIEVEEMN